MTTEATATRYFKTGAGSHYHSEYYCANFRRSLYTGDPITVTASDIRSLSLAPCTVCITEATKVTEVAPKIEKTYCTGSGQSFTNSRRIYSTCPECGKTLKVKSGGVPKHQPQA